MAVLIEQQDDCWGLVCRRQRFAAVGDRRSEGLAVSVGHVGVSVIDAEGRLLLLQQILQLAAIADPDLLPQVVEPVEHGESLLGGAGGGDLDGDWTPGRG